MPGITIVIPYNGAKSISINHYKVGGNMAWKLTPEATATKEEIIWLVKNALQFTTWIPKAPLMVTISGYFKDARSAPDLHNCEKLILDSIEDALKAICPPGVSDKYMSVICRIPFLGEASPRIEIVVERGRRR